MSLAKKVKTALDETRLLILGAQVLFGFQLNGAFQEGFSGLTHTSKLMTCAGQALMVLSITLLIAPSMQHRLVEGGEDSNRIHRITGLYAGWALLPFEISLGIGFYVVFDHVYGQLSALVMGSVFCLLAGFFWFGLEFLLTFWSGKKAMPDERKPTPLPTKVDQMLTEARVILPGAQALLGFQLTVTLTRSFEQLPEQVKLLHVTGLCCVGLAVILLMTPAALHRITFAGEDTESFFRLGSGFVIAAPVFLALGIASDLFVAAYKSSESTALATVVSAASLVLLALFWFTLPLYIRFVKRA
jgi:Family of unknown function (DUF6328)